MSTCYELSLVPNYVSDWDFEMAVRELIQNGTDQELLNPECKFSLDYEDGHLRFTNKNTKLDVNTLLLGNSTKTDDKYTVGKFGEGYKIAALVLNRLGKTFTILNGKKNEIWTARFKKSKKWNDRILAFFVENQNIASSDLIIDVGNVTEQEYVNLENIWLGFYYDCSDDNQKALTSFGEILLAEELKGQVFVNGLYVDCNADFHYGYNFKPQYLNLERDRKSCDNWDAECLTGKMVSEAMVNGDIPIETVKLLVEEDTDDVTNIDLFSNNKKSHVSDMLLDAFDEQYCDSIPVESQKDYDKVKAYGGNPVIVPTRVASLLSSTRELRIQQLVEKVPDHVLTPKEELQRWYDIYKNRIPYESQEPLIRIINML